MPISSCNMILFENEMIPLIDGFYLTPRTKKS